MQRSIVEPILPRRELVSHTSEEERSVRPGSMDAPRDGLGQHRLPPLVVRRRLNDPRRLLVVGATVEQSAGLALAGAAPLLEEEGYSGLAALVPDRKDPCRTHGPRPRAALASQDDPVDAAQVERAQVLEQGLDRQEPRARRGGA